MNYYISRHTGPDIDDGISKVSEIMSIVSETKENVEEIQTTIDKKIESIDNAIVFGEDNVTDSTIMKIDIATVPYMVPSMIEFNEMKQKLNLIIDILDQIRDCIRDGNVNNAADVIDNFFNET